MIIPIILKFSHIVASTAVFDVEDHQMDILGYLLSVGVLAAEQPNITADLPVQITLRYNTQNAAQRIIDGSVSNWSDDGIGWGPQWLGRVLIDRNTSLRSNVLNLSGEQQTIDIVVVIEPIV